MSSLGNKLHPLSKPHQWVLVLFLISWTNGQFQYRSDGDGRIESRLIFRQIWREALSRQISECVEEQLAQGISAEWSYDYCDALWNARLGDWQNNRLQARMGHYIRDNYRPNIQRLEVLKRKPYGLPNFRPRGKFYERSHFPVSQRLTHRKSATNTVSKDLTEKIRRRHIMSILMATMLSLVVVFAAILFVWSSTGRNMGHQARKKLSVMRMFNKIFRPDRRDDCEGLLSTDGDCPKVKVNDRYVEFLEEKDCPVRSDYSTIKLDTVMSYLEKYKDQKFIDLEWLNLLKFNSIPEPSILNGPRPKLNYNEIFDDDIKNPLYIASSWPHGCAQEFWNVVWHRNCEVIVNLCLDDEFAEVYWPSEAKIATFGYLEIHYISEHKYDDNFSVRMFIIRDKITNLNRTVCQYHYFMWSSDSMRGFDVDSLLNFRRVVNRSIHSKSPSGILLVHCSDGLGRTGSYILLDLVLNRITQGAKEVNISATLQHMRTQRPGLVKTNEQFENVFIGTAKEIEVIVKFCNDSAKGSEMNVNV